MKQILSDTIINWEKTNDELIKHLRALLQIDTRNPPGNETRAAIYLQQVLQQEDIECRIAGPSPDRGSLIARLYGDGTEAPLLLMSHTDVVGVEADQWKYDPFAATIDDGFIYGRGALDMKNMVAMELMTMLLLKRAGLPLRRDVIFLAAADEETGGIQGADWIVRNHPELIRAEYALNEGGGSATEVHRQVYYSIQTSEKGTARFRLRTHGRPGHASIPHNENAISRLAALLVKLQEQRLPAHLTTTVREYLQALIRTQPSDVAHVLQQALDEEHVDEAIDNLVLPASYKDHLRAMVRNTITPTILRAGSQINVIPSMAEVLLDGRILPGWNSTTFLEEVRSIVGDDCEIELLDTLNPLEVDISSPLIDVVRQVLSLYAPEATLVPTLMVGGTDAVYLNRLGTKVYGFAPELYIGGDERSRVHGPDERVSVKGMEWSNRVLFEIVARFVCA